MSSVSSGLAGTPAIRAFASAIWSAEAVAADALRAVKSALTAGRNVLVTHILPPMAGIEGALYPEWFWTGESSRRRRDARRVRTTAQWLSGRAAIGAAVAIEIERDFLGGRGAAPADAFCDSLVEHCADAIIATDLGDVITLWNRSAERLFGWQASEIVGKPISQLFPATSCDDDIAQFESAKQGRAFSYHDAVRIRRDGALAICSVSLSPIINPSGKIIGAVEVARDLSGKRQQQHRQQELYQRFYRADLQQRATLARNVHDQAAQYITSLSLGLNAIERYTTSPEGLALLVRLRQQLDELSIELHRVVMELRPAALTRHGLRSALRTMLDEWSERSQIAVRYSFDEIAADLPSEIETTLFRIVQEGLSNIAKHAAGATKVEVLLRLSENEIRLAMSDNAGGESSKKEIEPHRLVELGKFGLVGMQERVAMVGGRFEAVLVPGAGMTLSATIPLAERRQ